MQKSCDEIDRILVDYADGQLSPSESSEVAEHLVKCEGCRRTLRGLQRSLDLAGVIWEDALAETETIPISGKGPRIRWRRYATIAASILIVVGVSIWRTTEPEKAEPTFAEIERKISDAASAARLLAAAELLAEYPDAQHFVKKQYHYIIDTYPETPATTKAKFRTE